MTEEDYTLDSVDNLKKILREFPKKIRDKEEQILSIETKKSEAILKNKYIENEETSNILEEKDEDKKKFSNQAIRDAELSRRLNRNAEFLSNKKIIEDQKQILESAKIEISYLKRVNGNVRSIALLGA